MATATKAKPKKAPSKTVRLGFVIDESGSMGHLAHSIVAGYNEFVGTLQAEPNAKNVHATCGFFDTVDYEPTTRFKYTNVPLTEVQPLGTSDYNPRGGTPLYDAFAEVIGKVGQDAEDGERVMIVVMTDGMNNSSRETDLETLRKLVREREADGWEFIFMGANIDSYSASMNLGMSGAVGTYSNFAASAAGASNAMKVAGMRSAGYMAEDDVLARAAYKGSSHATPTTTSPDPEEFKRQQEVLLAAQKKARADAEGVAREKSQDAVSQARNIVRGGDEK